MNAAKRLTLTRFGRLCGFIEHRTISSVRNREENSGEKAARVLAGASSRSRTSRSSFSFPGDHRNHEVRGEHFSVCFVCFVVKMGRLFYEHA